MAVTLRRLSGSFSLKLNSFKSLTMASALSLSIKFHILLTICSFFSSVTIYNLPRKYYFSSSIVIRSFTSILWLSIPLPKSEDLPFYNDVCLRWEDYWFNFEVWGRILWSLRAVSSGSSVSLFCRGECRSVGSTLTSNLEVPTSLTSYTFFDIY